ncbi:MAG: YbaN family protein [Crocinitomicaceae bacterium]|nr:YbaN family protein [Crocinitomicaceae bacterium]
MKYFWIALGFLCVGLGIVGIALPLIPTTPFFLLAVFSFSKGSDKFYNWFKSTKMYKDYIESYRPGRPIKLSKKIEILTSVLIVLAASFYFVEKTYLKVILVSIFILHLVYFSVFIKTQKRDK